MRFLVCFVLLCLGLEAQSPPQFYSSIGMQLREQPAHQASQVPLHDSHVFGLIADATDASPPVQGIGLEIRNGGTLWFASSSTTIPTSSLVLQMAESTDPMRRWHFYSLSPITSNTWPMPLGYPGHDEIYSDPILMVPATLTWETLNPPPGYYITHDMSSVAVYGPYHMHFHSLVVPANPALIGQAYTAQSYRLQYYTIANPTPPYMFASDEVIFAIS